MINLTRNTNALPGSEPSVLEDAHLRLTVQLGLFGNLSNRARVSRHGLELVSVSRGRHSSVAKTYLQSRRHLGRAFLPIASRIVK